MELPRGHFPTALTISALTTTLYLPAISSIRSVRRRGWLMPARPQIAGRTSPLLAIHSKSWQQLRSRDLPSSLCVPNISCQLDNFDFPLGC